jgi:phosphate transport system permease protein
VTLGRTGDIWSTYGVWGFITGTEWVPSPVDGEPLFGALPFIYGTVVTAAIGMSIAVPISLGVALATTVFLPKRLRGPIAGIVDLLAAVPSVVYGFWGVAILVPAARPTLEWIAAHNVAATGIAAALVATLIVAMPSLVLRIVVALVATALGVVWLLAIAGVTDGKFTLLEGPVTAGSFVMAGLVLAVMVIPITTAITREVLLTVPVDQQEAAYALGATRWEMVRDAMIPWSRSGIVGASALGLGRAVGETIAMLLLLSSVPNIFTSLLGPGSTLAGVIVSELGEASELQLAALTTLAVVLFVISFLINAGARALVSRGTSGPRRRQIVKATAVVETAEVAVTPRAAEPPRTAALIEPRVPRGRRIRSQVAVGLVYASVVIALIPLGALLAEMLIKGLPVISWDFFTELPPTDPNNTEGAGISNALVGTLILMGIATVIAAPLGVLTALFMNEMWLLGRIPRRFANGVGFFVDVLLGVPSVVVGLTVYLGIVLYTDPGKFSAMAGGVALAIIMFPIVVRSADEILRLVPSAQREAALALGAPRWRTMWSVVLPAAAPGILTGIVLALARASGETAPLLFTSLGNQFNSTDLTEPIAALPQLIFDLVINTRTEESVAFAWAATLVLVAIILVLNLVARLIGRLATNTERR